MTTTNNNDGGPAFPFMDGVRCAGMSRLDYFAAAALTGVAANGAWWKETTEEAIAAWAYKAAAAMLAESERRAKG